MKQTMDHISEVVSEGPFVAFLLDETRDVANTSQLVVYARLVLVRLIRYVCCFT